MERSKHALNRLVGMRATETTAHSVYTVISAIHWHCQYCLYHNQVMFAVNKIRFAHIVSKRRLANFIGLYSWISEMSKQLVHRGTTTMMV